MPASASSPIVICGPGRRSLVKSDSRNPSAVSASKESVETP